MMVSERDVSSLIAHKPFIEGSLLAHKLFTEGSLTAHELLIECLLPAHRGCQRMNSSQALCFTSLSLFVLLDSTIRLETTIFKHELYLI